MILRGRSCVEHQHVGRRLKRNCFLASPPIQNTVIPIIPHQCLLVSSLLRQMLGQQEAPLQIRYVKTVGDSYHVRFFIIVDDVELECPLSRHV